MKRLLCMLLCSFLTLACSVCIAGDSEQHENELELILLGQTLTDNSKDPKNGNDKKEVLFGYLEDAIYLCIDQMGNQGQKWLNELNDDFQVKGLPKSIDEFAVPTSEHERYTHLGWDYQYYPMKEAWAIRQNILLATVSKVFGFPVDESKTGNERYSMQCTEMAKLIYYIHILGDHEHNKLETATQRIQLRNAMITIGEYQSGLINELRACIRNLLWSQRNSYQYSRLMVKLNIVRFRAWRAGEEDSENKHTKVQDIAKDTLDYLRPQLRNLLLNNGFFSVFR